MRTCGEHQFMTGRLQSAAHGDLLHVSLRFSVRPGQPWKVQHCHSLRSRDPEPAITGKSRVGEAKAALRRIQAVGAAECCVIEWLIVSPQSLKAGGLEPENAVSAKPHVSFLCLYHVDRPDLRGGVDRPVVFEPENSLGSHGHIKAAGWIFPKRKDAKLGERWNCCKPVPGQLIDSTDGSHPDAAVSIL